MLGSVLVTLSALYCTCMATLGKALLLFSFILIDISTNNLWKYE